MLPFADLVAYKDDEEKHNVSYTLPLFATLTRTITMLYYL